MSRTSNSIKNIKYSMVGQIINLLSSFINRMFFVRILGSEYLGLHGLFTNILSILSFAELGIGTAIIYSMYEPLAKKDDIKLKGLMNFYKQTYISIGIVILIIGSTLTPFLEFFINDMPNIPYIRLIYLMYVANTGFSYFFSYKRSLLIADQKKYIESFYHYLFYLICSVLQITILLFTKNFLLYLGTQILITLIENIVIAKKVDKSYNFLKGNSNIRLEQKERNIILKNVKALFLHKLGTVVVTGTDNILISKFVGIVQVGLYSNYLLIIYALNQLIGIVYQSITASIGNLGATENCEKSKFIFSCLDLLGYWIYAFATICLINLFNPFITIWLGEEYLLPMPIVILIIISFYLTGRRKSVLTFKDALGLFWYDRYKPLFESLINLIISLILGKLIGMQGIIIGTIISTLTTCFWIEPYVLHKYGFKSSARPYFKNYLLWTLNMFIIGVITWALSNMFLGYTILGFIGKLLVCLIVPNVLFLITFWNTREFQYLFNIIKPIIYRFSKRVQ